MRERDWYRYHRHEAWIRQGKRCAYCETPISEEDVTADHVRPRIRGGTTVHHGPDGEAKSNILAACERCNRAKGSLKKQSFRKILQGRAPHRNIDQLFSGILYRVHKQGTRAREHVRKCMA